MIHTDLLLVGAGPIGIELAVALRRRGIHYIHLEAGQVGATMFRWPPQTRWFSSNERIAIAGVPLQTADQTKATREDYLAYLRSVVQQFDLPIRTYEPVIHIERSRDGFLIRTKPLRGESVYSARRIVLATGGTTTPRRLGVEGEDLPHVSHALHDPHMYFRQRLLIVGGKNSAVEAALRCNAAGAHVAFSYRRSGLDERHIKYWLLPEFKSLAKSGRIRACLGSAVSRITPDHVTLVPTGLPPKYQTQPPPEAGESSLRDFAITDRVDIPVDFVLIQVGYIADMSLARMAGVELRGDYQVPVFDESTMETNVPGVYIAGTAIAGTQETYRVFLENCHIHVDRIVAAITGEPPPQSHQLAGLPES